MTTPFVNVGDILAGKYRVERILGIGGMGMVVAVTNLELEQRLALKLMRSDTAASAQAKERFLSEARAAVRLRGEHVCRVFDTGKLDGGEPYIAMEMLEGEDFSRLLSKRAPMAVSDAVSYVMQALEGVAEAHANGIIHRDLKPGNLFVAIDNDGSPLVKVLDFGISKSSAGGITQTGDVMGSPSYMAPEQMISAKDVDVRADIWALGVILYQATSRRLPYEQESLPALVAALATEEPTPLDQVAPTLPPDFVRVVMRCLAKQRDDRTADVGELATLLAPFGSPDVAPSAQRIVKVLRRTKAPSKAPVAYEPTIDPAAATRGTLDPNANKSSVAFAATAATADDPAPLAQSTFGASAAESLSRAPARHRTGLLVALVAVAAAGVTVALIATNRTDREPTAGSAPSVTAPEPDATPPPAEVVEPTPLPLIDAGAGSAIAEGSANKSPTQKKSPRPKAATMIWPGSLKRSILNISTASWRGRTWAGACGSHMTAR